MPFGNYLSKDNEIRQKNVTQVWGTALTALLMAGLILLLIPGYIWLITVSERNGIFFGMRLDEIWLPCLTFIGTALGGALGIRMSQLSWRQVIQASLLAGASLMVIAAVSTLFSSLSPWRIDALGLSGLPIALFFMIVVAAGVFLLPLFDPVMRKRGPAPPFWKVASTALLLSLFMIWQGLVDFYSLLGVLFVGILPGLGIAIGLILSLWGRPELGAWLGGLAVLLPIWLWVFLLFGFQF
jgi:hypothetical protein